MRWGKRRLVKRSGPISGPVILAIALLFTAGITYSVLNNDMNADDTPNTIEIESSPAFSIQVVSIDVGDAGIMEITGSPVLGVGIDGSANFGTIHLGSTATSTTYITVTNTGTVNETYSLYVATPSGWTAGTTQGPEIFVLNAAFSADASNISWNESNHALSSPWPMQCTSTRFAGDQTGVNIPPGETRKLWLQFKAPTNTNATSQQLIQIIISAEET